MRGPTDEPGPVGETGAAPAKPRRRGARERVTVRKSCGKGVSSVLDEVRIKRDSTSILSSNTSGGDHLSSRLSTGSAQERVSRKREISGGAQRQQLTQMQLGRLMDRRSASRRFPKWKAASGD
jgi:hypothetical protein